MGTDIRFGEASAQGKSPLLLAGLLALIVCAAWALYEARLLDALRSSGAVSARERSAQSNPRPRTPVAEQREVAAVIAQLNTPLPRILAAVTPPVDQRVALLGLQLAANQAGSIKLSGEAEDFATMTNYLAWLEGSPALHSVQLSSHEVDPAVPGRPVRFQMEIKWKR